MKKTLLLLTVFASIVIVSCSKLKDLGKVNFDAPLTESVVLPDSASLGLIGNFPPEGISFIFPAVNTATNSQATLKQYNTSSDKIDSVTLKSLALQLSSSSNFDFVDTIRVYVSAVGQSSQLLAYQYGIPAGTTTINLTPVDIDMKQYFIQDSIGFQLQAHFKALPPAGNTLNISTHFNVYGNVLN
jgi:hypothetical protein